jgi:hypothetical protein
MQMREVSRTAALRVLAASFAIGLVTTTAFAYGNSVTYRGQGLTADGFGGWDLSTELCGVANGAEVDGPYLLFVMTATAAGNADITFSTGTYSGTYAMTKTGNGTFKYVSPWIDPSMLPGNVTGTYDGKAKNVQLVVSHGCRPFLRGAWCSPGFWRNATAGAWALTGYSPSDLFNTTVYDGFYGATYASDPSLDTVLSSNGGTYKGPGVAGTSGYPLNAFNATGAFLTNQIPGFQFDWDVMVAGASDACPLDHFGNFK